jgi:endonuclease/exonuclease/phosphatase family metal-dependent hydrolase
MKKIGLGVLIAFLIFVVYAIYVANTQIPLNENHFTWTSPSVDHAKNQYTVLSANIGNSDWQCTPYKWKLCKKIVEARLAQNIQTIKPDLVNLQEVLPPWRCESSPTTDPAQVCSEPQTVHQSRRVLGNDYTIVCDPRSGYECIAVRKDAGAVDGCPLGELCFTARTAPVETDCDPGFSIIAVTVRLNNGAVFDMVNAHPASMSDSCRASMLRRAFTGDQLGEPVIQNPKVLITGDFNMDPWRSTDQSAKAWQEIFEKGWSGNGYRYLSGIAENDPPRYTFFFVYVRTLDVALSNFATGIMSVMGETPGTPRLDGGSGNDHKALYGVLELTP